MTGFVNATGSPTRTGLLSDRYGSGFDLLAALRKLVDAPSSSVTARAALSATTAAYSAEPGRAASVGCTSGLSPAARPISPYWLAEYTSVTVNAPCGASSIPSRLSRWAAVPGSPTVAGTGAVTVDASSFVTPVAVISVRPLNSLTAPVTLT